ncbi:MAG: dephospho-CoA kinase [Solirubrobacterales bacterium]
MTGGVAAGKSEALAALERIGLATVSSDQLVHDLLDREPARSRIEERWGTEVVVEGGAAVSSPTGPNLSGSNPSSTPL